MKKIRSFFNLSMKFGLLSLIYLVCIYAEAQLDVTFKKEKIRIKEKTILVEIADTPERSARGLMFRKMLAADEGMIFIFPDEDVRAFWMKNTSVPLSIAYIGKNKKIVDIQDMQPGDKLLNPPSYPSARPAMYALEMNQGWFNKNKIKIGDQFQWLDRKNP